MADNNETWQKEQKPFDLIDSTLDLDPTTDIVQSTTDESYNAWLTMDIKSIRDACQPHPEAEEGKWMMYIKIEKLDAKWQQCCQMYQAGKLEGITHMRVSKNNSKKGVIMLYCGPADDESTVMKYGHNLLDVVGYDGDPTDQYRAAMYYKTEEQTAQGNIATGQMPNHIYRIPIEEDTGFPTMF